MLFRVALTNTSKPSIIISPGASALPEYYDVIVDPIAEKGYEIKALHLPTLGLKTGPREGAPPSLYDDSAFIAKEVEKLAEEGKDVILLGHSYGGVPMSECTKGLSKYERKVQGKKGGIVALVYMTSLVPAVGESPMQLLMSVPDEKKVNFRLDEQGWFHQNDVPKAAAMILSEWPKTEAETWVGAMPCHSSVCFMNALTYPGYKDLPVYYLLCEEDNVILLENQRAGIEVIESASARRVDVTSLKAGHLAPLTHTKETLAWLNDVLKKVASQ